MFKLPNSASTHFQKVIAEKPSNLAPQNILIQVALMEKLRHPNIVHFEEAFFDKTMSSMCIVMQYCDGGDLSEQIKRAKNVPFRETKILHWFVQIGLGLHHMHMRKIMHRDLKVFIYAHSLVS